MNRQMTLLRKLKTERLGLPIFSTSTSHQLKGCHGLSVSLVLSLAVYAQLPLFALDFRHGI